MEIKIVLLMEQVQMTTWCSIIGGKGLVIPWWPEYGLSAVLRGNVRKHENPEKGDRHILFFYPLRRRKKASVPVFLTLTTCRLWIGGKGLSS